MTDQTNEIFRKELKHFLRLSSQRDAYTIPQAAFRLNCDRHDFKFLFIDTGKIKIELRNGKELIPRSEIERYYNEIKLLSTNESERAG